MQTDQSNLMDVGLMTMSQSATGSVFPSNASATGSRLAGSFARPGDHGTNRSVFIETAAAENIAGCREEYGNDWMAVVRALSKMAQIAIDEGRL